MHTSVISEVSFMFWSPSVFPTAKSLKITYSDIHSIYVCQQYIAHNVLFRFTRLETMQQPSGGSLENIGHAV